MTILAVGPIADSVLDAVEGTGATVLYTNVPRPIDADGLRAAVVGSEIVVVEPYLVGSSVPILSLRTTALLQSCALRTVSTQMEFGRHLNAVLRR